jgi:Ser/Thr protein kinase RdoA (MazF antagonist)
MLHYRTRTPQNRVNQTPIQPAPRLADWLQRMLASRATIALHALPGATSSRVYAVAIAGVPRFVLRLFTNSAWLAEQPDLAEHEAAALLHAARADLPAPRLVARGSADECGVPAILMTLLPGAVDLHTVSSRPALAALADMLARIHATTARNFAWQFQSWRDVRDRSMPPWLADHRLWADALALANAPAPTPAGVFLHRDFHPVNVLWDNGAVSGVVDWVNACRGPAGVDVAHCRLNLALMYGFEQVDAFTDAYCNATSGYQHDPYWDIDVVLGWNLRTPQVYAPWHAFGLTKLSVDVVCEALRTFVRSAVVSAARR